MARRAPWGIVLAALMLVVACGGVASEDRPAPLKRSDATAVVLNPTTDPSTSQTFTWRSRADKHRVVVIPRAGGDDRSARAKRKEATTVRESGSDVPAWSATITGLEPQTEYAYRIESGDGALVGEFETAADRLVPWTFLALGDTQVDNADVPAGIVRVALGAEPEAALVLQAGDLVNHPYEGQEWAEAMEALEPARTSRNVAMAVGNHERCILVHDCRDGDAQGYRAYSTNPDNGFDDQQPTWFAFDLQGVRFVVLDSFADDLPRQAEFLDEQLKTNDQRWSVVLLHSGPFASREDRTNAEVYSEVLPIIEEHDVDLVLSGHDHVYSSGYRGDPDSTVYAASDSGPKFYTLSGADWERRGATRTQWAEQVSTYQVVDVTHDELRYRAVVAARGRHPKPAVDVGEALDEVAIAKAPDGSKTVTRR